MLYETLTEVQKTIEQRKNDLDFDYYSNDKVCVIHVKFGRMRKAYCGLNCIKDEYFRDNFAKFWAYDETSDFKTHWDVLNYVYEHNLPVIFYKNYTDEEISFIDTVKYFIAENGITEFPDSLKGIKNV